MILHTLFLALEVYEEIGGRAGRHVRRRELEVELTSTRDVDVAGRLVGRYYHLHVLIIRLVSFPNFDLQGNTLSCGSRLYLKLY